MQKIDIVRWAESPIGFYVDRSYDAEAARWVLGKAPIKLASYHADLLRHLFTPDETGRLPYDTICWCEPAKGGKSAVAGLAAQFMGLHGDTGSSVILASNKRDQAASIMYASFAESARMNPALRVEPGKIATTLPNENVVRAIPSNSRGEAGARYSLALFDELWAYVYLDAHRLWSEFKTDPTRTNSVRMAVGYAGYIGESELWQDLLESGLRGEPVPDLAHITNGGAPACWRNGRTFVFWSHECRQPWQTEEWIDGQRRTLRPAEFKRMIECEFSEGEGDFIDHALWLACIDAKHRRLAPHYRYDTDAQRVYIGLDLATAPGGDDAALVGLYADREGARVNLAFHKLWKGRDRGEQLKLSETVKPYILRMNQLYPLKGVWLDPWQGILLAEELRRAGIRVHEVPQSHSGRGEKDTTLHELIADQRLVLYDDPDIRVAALGASAKELGDGRIFLKKATGRSRIDLLVALSNVADVVLRSGARGTVEYCRYA